MNGNRFDFNIQDVLHLITNMDIAVHYLGIALIMFALSFLIRSIRWW